MLNRCVCWAACSVFDGLKAVRQLEYELDFAQNRAARDKAALKERLAAALVASQKLQVRRNIGKPGLCVMSPAPLRFWDGMQAVRQVPATYRHRAGHVGFIAICSCACVCCRLR